MSDYFQGIRVIQASVNDRPLTATSCPLIPYRYGNLEQVHRAALIWLHRTGNATLPGGSDHRQGKWSGNTTMASSWNVRALRTDASASRNAWMWSVNKVACRSAMATVKK